MKAREIGEMPQTRADEQFGPIKEGKGLQLRNLYSPTITVLVVLTSDCGATGTGWQFCPHDVNRLEGISCSGRKKKPNVAVVKSKGK